MKITRFEEIEGWKKARELTRQIYSITATGPFSKDFALRDQIRRATISIMSNIAEGFGRDGNKEFIQFLAVAKGSSGEVRAQLYVALDGNLLTQEQFNPLHKQTEEVARLINGFIRYLKQSDLHGRKMNRPEARRTADLELGT
jgi:four helix bundle protein